MKRVNIIVSLLLAGMATMTGCSKESSKISPAANATINYRLVAAPQAQASVLTWTTGYISAHTLTFNGTHIVGNSVRLTQFTTEKAQQVSQLGATDLGAVMVQPSAFDDVAFTLTLDQQQGNHALFMGGVFKTGEQTIAVVVNIDEQVILSSIWLQHVTIAPAVTYRATLTFDPAQFANGITSNDLSAAQRTAGQIIISSVSNVQLYQVIMSNLTEGLHVQFGLQPVFNANESQPVQLNNPAY